jgi:RNA recognition motif-containing protein
VSFNEEADLEKCLQEMNNVKVQGHEIILNRQGDNFRNPAANIIIKNIPKQISQQEVHETFSKFGQIKSCKLQTNPDRQSKGFAFVQYEVQAEAENAINALNKRQCWGAIIEIDIFKKSSERQAMPDQSQRFTNLYIQGLDPKTSRNEFREMFQGFGDIDSCTLKNNQEGIGFVSFLKWEDAAAALAKMNKTNDPHGSTILVSRFVYKHDNNNQPKGQLSQIAQNMKSNYENQIFINNLSMDVTEEQLREKFEQTGQILKLNLNRKPNRPHQTAMIMYKDFSGAQLAIQKFHDTRELCGHKPLSVDVWVSREELQNEHQQQKQNDLVHLFRSLIN